MSDPIAGPVTNAPAMPAPPFVFVTVGTDHHPFDRLVEMSERWAAQRGISCFIQTGTSRAAVSGTDYLPYPTMAEAMRRSVAVVSHGGPATIMLARQCGRVPIVVPRDPERGEHVDGHQQEFSRWMAAKGQIVLAHEPADLERHLDGALADPSRYRVEAGREETAAAVARFATLVDDLLERRSR